MRRIFLALAALSFASAASAQIIDKVETNDGSSYYGYISEQVPGKQVMIYAENASIVLKSKHILNKRKDHFDFDRLSESSKEIVRTTLRCDTTSLHLYSFEYDGKYYENLYLNDYMDSTVRAYALTPRTYAVKWDNLMKTSKVSCSSDPYGIRDIIVLKGGERYLGQIAEQVIAKSLLLQEEDGRVQTIMNSNILSISSEKISEKNTVWEQTPLLDRVVRTESEDPIEGLIVSRLFGQYVKILTRNGGEIIQIPMKSIAKYQKTPNPEYVPYVLDTAKVVHLNEIDVVMQGIECENEVYTRKDTLVYTYFVGTELKLALKNVPHQKTVALYEYTAVKDKSFLDALRKNGKEEVWVIASDAHPIYEATLVEEDGYMVCHVTPRKAGKYFLSIDGFDAGLNLVFVNKAETTDKSVNNEKDKK